MEDINLNDDVSFVDLAVDRPKKGKIISDPNRIRLASNSILKKYQRQRQKKPWKKQIRKLVNG